jgi:nucleoside-diphosphate-sugar epimerase
MRIFVTGATGWLGSAVVPDLISAGHHVTALTTRAGGAQKLQQQGAKAQIGRLADLALLREEASRSEGVIHLAFIHSLSHMSLGARIRLFAGALNGGIASSFMRILAQTETDAVNALGKGLGRSDRPLIVASGVLFLPSGRVSTEREDHVLDLPNRSMSEKAAFKFISNGVRASAVRLAPTVHGEGDRGFVAEFVKAARKKGVSPYIGAGANRWPAVHRQDAATLFRLALEKGAPGAKYHGVAEEGIPFKDIAALIGSRLNVPSVGISPQQAGKHFGFLSPFVGRDNPSSSDWTRDTLGWRPEGGGLLADMDAHYFCASG